MCNAPSRVSRQRGSSVEMALVVLLFFFLIFAILEFGRASVD